MNDDIDNFGHFLDKPVLNGLGDGMAFSYAYKPIDHDMEIDLDAGAEITGSDVVHLQNTILFSGNPGNVFPEWPPAPLNRPIQAGPARGCAWPPEE